MGPPERRSTAALRRLSVVAGGPAVASLVWPGAPEEETAEAVPVLSSGLPGLDAVLAHGGLPLGAVTEVRSRLGLGGLSVAMRVCAQALAQDPQALCAVVDIPGTLHAPAVMEAGIRPGGLWCVRPREPAQAGSIALRLIRSAAFRVVVVDHLQHAPAQPELAVRRLSVAAQEAGCVVVWLSGPWADRVSLPLPVALRLRLARSGRDRITMTVDKQRGSAGGATANTSWPLPGSRLTHHGEAGADSLEDVCTSAMESGLQHPL